MRGGKHDWGEYVDSFHAAKAGITEEVLSRASDRRGCNPYRWVTRDLTGDLVVDVGCGSAPTAGYVNSRWVGVDRSASEISLARARARGPLVVGDATALPLRSGCADAVVVVMALMVVGEPAKALEEAARVLRQGGVFRALLPARSPIGVRDKVFWAALLAAVGVREPPFPARTDGDELAGLLRESGFELVEDVARRFPYRIGSRRDADLLVDSLYLPGVPERRLAAARRLARLARGEVGLPLRRITATLEKSRGADRAARASSTPL